MVCCLPGLRFGRVGSVLVITSRANPRIKLAKLLLRRRGRLREGRWLVEGVRPLEEALRHEAQIDTVFFTAQAASDERIQAVLELAANAGATVAEVPADLLNEITDAQTPQGIIGIVLAPPLDANVFSSAEPFLLVVDRVQDPGNLGTLCRTALAAAVDGVVLLPGTVDPGNPKVVRASSGALFGLNLAVLQPEHLIQTMRRVGTRLVTADLSGTTSIYDADWRGSVALLVGHEAAGPDEMLKQASDAIVKIPMPGPVESLNVATATALCLFEAVRVRSVPGASTFPLR